MVKYVYIVGHDGPEHNFVFNIHERYEEALKTFHKIRKELLEEAKDMLRKGYSKETYERIIKNLSEEDPEKINNGPFETPYIKKIPLLK